MANKTKAGKNGTVFSPVSKNRGKLTKEIVNCKQENPSETEMDDLRLSNVYIKPLPTASFTLDARIKSISRGQAKLFPSEYE